MENIDLDPELCAYRITNPELLTTQFFDSQMLQRHKSYPAVLYQWRGEETK